MSNKDDDDLKEKTKDRPKHLVSVESMAMRREKLCLKESQTVILKKEIIDYTHPKEKMRITNLLIKSNELFPEKWLHQSQIAEILNIKRNIVDSKIPDVRTEIFAQKRKALDSEFGCGYRIAEDEESAVKEGVKSIIRSYSHGNTAESIFLRGDYNFDDRQNMDEDIWEVAQSGKMLAIIHKHNTAMNKDLMSEFNKYRRKTKEQKKYTQQPQFTK